MSGTIDDSKIEFPDNWQAYAVAIACLIAFVIGFRGCRNSGKLPPPVSSQRVHTSTPEQMAIVYVADAYYCPSCVVLKDDLKWLASHRGWECRWRIEIDNRGRVPRIEYYEDGRLVNTHVGYTDSDDWSQRRPILKSIAARF